MSQKTAQMPQHVRKPVMQQIFEHPKGLDNWIGRIVEAHPSVALSMLRYKSKPGTHSIEL